MMFQSKFGNPIGDFTIQQLQKLNDKHTESTYKQRQH